MAPTASRYDGESFELDLSGRYITVLRVHLRRLCLFRVISGYVIDQISLEEENISDSRSVASFGDDVAPIENGLALDEFRPDLHYDQAEILFAQDDNAPLSDPVSETAFDVSTTRYMKRDAL